MKKILTLENVRGKRTFVRRALANNRRTKNISFGCKLSSNFIGGSVSAILNTFLEFF